MKINHLSEGVIKVPPPLLKNYYKHLLKVISTTIIQSIYRGEYLTGSDIDIYIMNIMWNSKTMVIITILQIPMAKG